MNILKIQIRQELTVENQPRTRDAKDFYTQRNNVCQRFELMKAGSPIEATNNAKMRTRQ
jgi:hypothetical protein